MNPLTATSKGAATRDAIIEKAYEIARFAGIEGLSIGPLAQAVGMSKSGVFAHFGSREDLQLAVLESAGQRFGEFVLGAALSQPRGLPPSPRCNPVKPRAGGQASSPPSCPTPTTWAISVACCSSSAGLPGPCGPSPVGPSGAAAMC